MLQSTIENIFALDLLFQIIRVFFIYVYIYKLRL
jgi:hypothetical protein